MRNSGTTALDEQVYEKVHDALAKMFDFAIQNPLALINLGHGNYVTAAAALVSLNEVPMNVVDTHVTHGAVTTMLDSVSITFNPQDPDPGFNSWIAGYGDAGIDFTIFHEFGHAIYDVIHNAPSTEAMADSAAFSMMEVLGITPPPREAAAAGGFDD